MKLDTHYVSTPSPDCMHPLWPWPTDHGLLTSRYFRLMYVKHLCFRVALRITVMIFGQHLHLSDSIWVYVEHWPTFFCLADFLLFLSLCMIYSHDTLQTYWGRIISVASSMFGFDLYFCFIDLMLCFTDLMLLLSLYIGYSHKLCKNLHMGRIVSVASFMNGLDLYFCFTDFICFTDLMLFLSPYFG